MAHNGGKHEWDITPAQAKEAAYVSPKAYFKAETKKGRQLLTDL